MQWRSGGAKGEGRGHQFPPSLNAPVPTVGPLGFQIKGEIKKTSKKEQLQEEKERLTSLEESEMEVRNLGLTVQRSYHSKFARTTIKQDKFPRLSMVDVES